MSSTPEFLGPNYLLDRPLARRLYREHAEGLPIVDVHSHLSAREIERDHVWPTITDLWLGEDHYKWRAMRLAGFREELITGPADPWDRFEAWAATVPRLVGNPLYVWTHLELKRAFGVDDALSPATARRIYDAVNEQLPEMSARRILAHFDVELVATTDDPTNALEDHQRLTGGEVRVVPTFRPDAAHALLSEPERWNQWVDALVTVGDAPAVADLASLLGALASSFRRMAALGARASDHGLTALPDRQRDPDAADRVVRRAREGQVTTPADRELVLLEVVALAARLAAADDSVLQLHLGPLRNVSPRLLREVGRDAGSDVVDDARQANGLARFLGELEREGMLPRTVLYNLNPANNTLFAAMAGAFARPGVAGLVQWGPPWWFNDHEAGIREQLAELARVNQLASFIGMLTDSRSLLSMTRHELFRRVLCDVVAAEMEAGSIPADVEAFGGLVRDVCVDNARSFFGFTS